MINNILLYFQFLTRVPINKNLDCSEKNFKDGIFSFVLVGAFLGLVDYGIMLILKDTLPANIVAGILVIIPIILTGGMQIDGIGDTCDGFFAFKSGGKERRIAIMKDSYVGTFSVISIIWLMIMKFSLITHLIEGGGEYGIFMFMVLSRLGVMFSAYIAVRAKEQGTGNLYIENISFKGLAQGTLLAITFGFLSGELINSVIIIPILFLCIWLFNKYCLKKIGGQTGDTLGASNEICEVVALIMMVMFL